MKWVVEPDVFGEDYEHLIEVIKGLGHEVVLWKEEWLSERADHIGDGVHVIFHGSLNVASKLREAQPAWFPGAFCDVERHTVRYLQAAQKDHVLNRVSRTIHTQVAGLGIIPLYLFPEEDRDGDLFVRPNGPLKQFSGRIIPASKVVKRLEGPEPLYGIDPKEVDYGFYFEDKKLPIVICPARDDIAAEFRCFVVGQKLVAMSRYDPDDRSSVQLSDGNYSVARSFAESVLAEWYIGRPDQVFVMDVAILDNGEPKIIETNPFSGADPYVGSLDSIESLVSEVSAAAQRWVLPCCETMKAQLTMWCDQHGAECPDAAVCHSFDGSVSLHSPNATYRMAHCPWCGTGTADAKARSYKMATLREVWADPRAYTEPEEGTHNWRVHVRTDPTMDAWSVVAEGPTEGEAIEAGIEAAWERDG